MLSYQNIKKTQIYILNKSFISQERLTFKVNSGIYSSKFYFKPKENNFMNSKQRDHIIYKEKKFGLTSDILIATYKIRCK